jgi:hypothetical protein
VVWRGQVEITAEGPSFLAASRDLDILPESWTQSTHWVFCSTSTVDEFPRALAWGNIGSSPGRLEIYISFPSAWPDPVWVNVMIVEADPTHVYPL